MMTIKQTLGDFMAKPVNENIRALASIALKVNLRSP
jgi:hypothetical protein